MSEWAFLKPALKQAKEVVGRGIEEEVYSDELMWELMEIDPLKEVTAYNKSEENLKNCEPFEQLNQKYILLYKQHKNSFNELYQEVEKKAYRREYAKSMWALHRGFYSPSAMDLVVVGVKRGKLFKGVPRNSKDVYEYIFDDKDNLICVYFYSQYNGKQKPIEAELFIREKDKVLSLKFEQPARKGCELNLISECYYEKEKLMRYECANYSFIGDESEGSSRESCFEVNVEVFEYVNDLMQSFCYCSYIPLHHMLSQERYTFSRDKDGYLSTYICEQIGGFVHKTNFDANTYSYKVLGKRK